MKPVRFDADELADSCFDLFPIGLARTHHAVPLGAEPDGTIVVAVTDTEDLSVRDDLRIALRGRRWRLLAAEPASIEAALQRWERRLARLDEAAVAAQITVVDDDLEDETGEAGNVARLVNQILADAVELGASDVHFEPRERDVIVRFRIDGVLLRQRRFERKLTSALVNRLKVLGGIDVANRLRAQDGRFARTFGERTVDCRVVTLPSVVGDEAAVVRLLDRTRRRLGLADLGLGAALVADFEHLLAASPWGMVLVTGPTGSGKTTSLYASLPLVAHEDRKVLSIEDPVEYRYDELTQVQVNTAADLTFASALRSFLRADPDVILVGEIRDPETAKIATEAALTGHLVLSTLHTNAAAHTPARLTDLGVEPYLIASSLRAVLSQRLVRRVCDACAIEEPVEEWPFETDPPPVMRRGAGCSRCTRTGYRGRLAVGELLIVDDRVAQAIADRRPAQEIAAVLRAQGRPSLAEAAVAAVRSGATNLDEIRRLGIGV